MNSKTTGLTDRSLAAALVGKSITAVDGDSITLGDGTVLHVERTADCCAWYEGSVRAINLSDNIVTDVRYDDLDSDEPDSYTLTVLSSSNELLAVDVEGDPSNGYYVHAADLRIVTKEKA